MSDLLTKMPLKYEPMFIKGFTWNNGRVYDVAGELVSNPNIWYPSLESWQETKQKERNDRNMPPKNDLTAIDDRYCVANEAGDPKDHSVGIYLNVSANDYNNLKATISPEVLDKIELRREIAVMHEVMASDGYSMIDKIDNTIDKWANEKNKKLIKLERYKLKYR